MDGYWVLLPKCVEVCWLVEMKLLTIQKGSIMNSLSPSGPMTDWDGGSVPSSPSVESPSDLFASKSSSLMEGEVANGFLSSLEVPGSFLPYGNTSS